MDDECSNVPLTGRDVAGAWLVCVLIAVLALGLASDLHGGVPPAATVTAEMPPCPPAAGSICPPSPEAAAKTVGSVAGLHRLTLPMERPSEKHRPG